MWYVWISLILMVVSIASHVIWSEELDEIYGWDDLSGEVMYPDLARILWATVVAWAWIVSLIYFVAKVYKIKYK